MTVNLEKSPSVDEDILALLRCPQSKTRLRWCDNGTLESESRARYKYDEGIFHLLTPLAAEEGLASIRKEKDETKSYYDVFGWASSGGEFKEVQTFTDRRSAPWSYTSRCIKRVKRHVAKSGRFILDAASGPIPYDEYLEFHQGFEKRVCVDLSVEALRKARERLGDRGIYILGDLTNLPLADGSMDAAVSFHTIYHIPADEQQHAFTELHRVLAPNARAAAIYSWGYSPLNARLTRLLDRFGVPESKQTAGSGLYYGPQEKEWFLGRAWPFDYDISVWRTIGSSALQRLGGGPVFRTAYAGLFALEEMFPRFFGLHGQYPIIVIRRKSGT